MDILAENLDLLLYYNQTEKEAYNVFRLIDRSWLWEIDYLPEIKQFNYYFPK